MREITEHRGTEADKPLSITAQDDDGREYLIVNPANGQHTLIIFQGMDAAGSGITNEALLAIVADRLKSFQAGPFKCQENMVALSSVERALYWLHRRTAARVKRGVEGTAVA